MHQKNNNTMEYNRKTIMWDNNSEPPKNYIWAKNNKFYEYDYVTRSWVESKLISGSGSGSGDSTPTEFYIKFKAENFGIRNQDNVPDTIDRSKGYTFDEIFDTSDDMLEKYIKVQENVRDTLVSNGYYIEDVSQEMGCYYYIDGNPHTTPEFNNFNYLSYESGNISSMDGSYPVISVSFIKCAEQCTAKTFIKVEGTNLNGYSWTPPMIVFGKNDEDGKWYIIYAR